MINSNNCIDCNQLHLTQYLTLPNLVALIFITIIVKGIFDKNVWMVVGGFVGVMLF